MQCPLNTIAYNYQTVLLQDMWTWLLKSNLLSFLSVFLMNLINFPREYQVVPLRTNSDFITVYVDFSLYNQALICMLKPLKSTQTAYKTKVKWFVSKDGRILFSVAGISHSLDNFSLKLVPGNSACTIWVGRLFVMCQG